MYACAYAKKSLQWINMDDALCKRRPIPLKTIDIRAAEHVRLSGRFDTAQPGFPMMWTAASAELTLTGSEL
jgi:hypothetical protein